MSENRRRQKSWDASRIGEGRADQRFSAGGSSSVPLHQGQQQISQPLHEFRVLSKFRIQLSFIEDVALRNFVRFFAIGETHILLVGRFAGGAVSGIMAHAGRELINQKASFASSGCRENSDGSQSLFTKRRIALTDSEAYKIFGIAFEKGDQTPCILS